MLAEIRDGLAPGVEIELWWQDEARVGQKNKITRRWAPRGTRPSGPHDQRTKSAYIFGAICPQKGKGAGLAMPWCDIAAMQEHLTEISATIDPGAHAVLKKLQAVESVTIYKNNYTVSIDTLRMFSVRRVPQSAALSRLLAEPLSRGPWSANRLSDAECTLPD